MQFLISTLSTDSITEIIESTKCTESTKKTIFKGIKSNV